MNAATRWQDIIAENLSAASVPGYKKREVSFDTIQAGLMAPGGPGTPAFLLPRPNSSVNLQQGELRRTGVPTDLAIDGPAFFEVQLSDGTLAYTRDGEFTVSLQGQLMTKNGLLVMGEGGPIQLDPNLREPLNVSDNGEVTQGGIPCGTLRLVEFDRPQLLTPVGPGLFLAQHPQLAIAPSEESSVRQEFLENSNTLAMTEMSNLITAIRHFETAQRVVQLQDERMGKTIAELAGNS